MEFKAAYACMRGGQKVKRPSWAGYWCWDEEAQTIVMHCRETQSDTGKDVLDIRETKRMAYTIENCLTDDWEIATECNTPILGGKARFGFGEAIKYVKRGLKVCREGWNGKGQYIQLATGISYAAPDGEIVNAEHDAIGNAAIAFHGTSGVQLGWLASQADMLAEDWMFRED